MASPAHHAATSSLRTEPPRFFLLFFFRGAARDSAAVLPPHAARFAFDLAKWALAPVGSTAALDATMCPHSTISSGALCIICSRLSMKEVGRRGVSPPLLPARLRGVLPLLPRRPDAPTAHPPRTSAPLPPSTPPRGDEGSAHSATYASARRVGGGSAAMRSTAMKAAVSAVVTLAATGAAPPTWRSSDARKAFRSLAEETERSAPSPGGVPTRKTMACGSARARAGALSAGVMFGTGRAFVAAAAPPGGERSDATNAAPPFDCTLRRSRAASSKMLGGASQTVSKIRVKCNGT